MGDFVLNLRRLVQTAFSLLDERSQPSSFRKDNGLKRRAEPTPSPSWEGNDNNLGFEAGFLENAFQVTFLNLKNIGFGCSESKKNNPNTTPILKNGRLDRSGDHQNPPLAPPSRGIKNGDA
jgi:hypothetical protein